MAKVKTVDRDVCKMLRDEGQRRKGDEMMATRHALRDTESGEVVIWTVKQILEDINRDRSEEWIDYDETDWREGLSEFGSTWEYIGIVKPRKS